MNKVYGFIILAASLGMSACQSNPPAAAQNQASNSERADGYRCENVQVTGSRMPQKRCTTAEERAQDKREADAAMRQNRVLSQEKN